MTTYCIILQQQLRINVIVVEITFLPFATSGYRCRHHRHLFHLCSDVKTSNAIREIRKYQIFNRPEPCRHQLLIMT